MFVNASDTSEIVLDTDIAETPLESEIERSKMRKNVTPR